MIGVVSMLTNDAYLQVERAQRWLEAEHGFTNPGYARPHITYVIGEGGEAMTSALADRTEILAEETDPFQIRLSGLGLFPEAVPVLYLAVQPSAELAIMQQATCQALENVGMPVRPYYSVERWIPHVTLASGMVTSEELDAVCSQMPAKGIELVARMTGLWLAEEREGGGWAITGEFPFRGQNQLGDNPFGLKSRPCQPYDREFVYRLVEETLRPMVTAYFDWDESLFEKNWQQRWRQRVMILAGGCRVGYIQYDPTPDDHLYIAGLFLVPTVHGRGWGEWLLKHMEGQAGGRSLRLHVWENNAAVAFYQRHGYQIIEAADHKFLMEKRGPWR